MENERYKESKPGDLEVDAYDPGLQFAYDKDNLPEALYPTPVGKSTRQKVSELPGDDVIIKKQEGTLFRLSIALGLSVIFAIVAAAFATIMAMQLHTVKRQLDNVTFPTTNQTCNTTTSTMIPTSDCKKLTTTYNAIISDTSYDLFCNANQPNGDLMSIWVYTFEDCIRACSSFDTTGNSNGSYCYGVSYAYTLPQLAEVDNSGNCWLKAVKRNASVMYSDVYVDSAFLQQAT